MESPANAIGAEGARSNVPARRASWLRSFLLGGFLLAVYLSNGRDLGCDDTFSASLIPHGVLRGNGIYFETTHLGVANFDVAIPYFWTRSRGHIVTMYPIAPGLVIVPLVAPQVAELDRVRPGWDRLPSSRTEECGLMAKRSMAVIVALTGIMLYRLLVVLGLCRVALPVVLATCLGSDLWTIGSQAAWQHGPAAFFLIAVISLLLPQPMKRHRLVLAGAATAGLFSCRLMDLVFVGAIGVWLMWTNRRGLLWFLPIPMFVGSLLLSYNLWFFGNVLGGQALLEEMHVGFHGVSGIWSTNFLEGALGTLVSPNRGLLVFSPWVLVAIASLLVPSVRRRLATHSLICALLWSLVPYLIVLSKYSVWWGGQCFGPRYWTDVVPLFAIVFAFGLDWMLSKSRALVVIAAMSIAVSIAIQVVGAFCYPSTWNSQPRPVDLNHERLWDWRDTELLRCLAESLQRPGR
jgi:hypothetical protein